jgi:hypothetical protein
LAACSGDTAGGDRTVRHVPSSGEGGGRAGTGAGTGTGGTWFGMPIQPRGGTGGAPMVDPDMCTNVTINVSRVTPTVMLVVDGSSSMVQNMYGADTRWAAIRTALIDPTNGVVPLMADRVKFGLAVYGTVATCPLPLGVIMPALDNAAAVTGGMPMNPPGMFTPTGLALDMIVDMLPDPMSGDPDNPIEPQIIVLATDGDPNDCMLSGGFGPGMANYAPSIAAAMKAQSKHQKIYVISVGMDAGAAHLQEMANIGAGMPATMTPGAPVFYPEDPAALATTLQTLVGAEISCEVALDGKGVVMGKECAGEVTINGTPLACNGPGGMGTGADGWRLIDSFHIELLGTTCEMFKATSGTMLIGNFPCDVVVE